MGRGLTLFLSAVALAVSGCLTPEVPVPRGERPNILLIVADDLGYSDIGAYGGEISTPNLDGLADAGFRATDFYVASRGGPSRAMLLTGTDNHIAGFGAPRRRLAANQEGLPGYEGQLSNRVVTVASLLRDAGYHTSIAGKWELGDTPENLPAARGFERSFVLHDGAASHWSDMRSAIPGRERAGFTRDGSSVPALPPEYFSTRHFTDTLLGYIAEARSSRRPFFAVLSYQAPHSPLASEHDPARGLYDDGYDAIRKRRLLRMKRMKLVREYVLPYPGLPTVPPWSALSDAAKRAQSRKMELYAAMVTDMDANIGRVLDSLGEAGDRDDTFIVFLSDNGPEPRDRGPSGMNSRDLEWYAAQFPLQDPKHWGREGSFIEYGPAWAQVSSVPFRLFKRTLGEGGLRSPLIVSGPGVAPAGRFQRPRISRAILHVADLAPTFLALAGVPYPASYRSRAIAPLLGKSLLPHLAGERGARDGPHEWLGFAYGSDRAVRRGDWKLVWMRPPFGVARWRLYHLDRDPSELYDLFDDRPKERRELLALWESYATANGVVLPEPAKTGIAADNATEEPASTR